ncbi:MAG: hypothetical protein HKN18_02665 [Silicimonas sp.]|nr:hypothetical protein [Silicimonas sp.]
MKVVRNTPDQLIVADIPWMIGIFTVIFILIFSYIGLSEGNLSGLFFALVGIAAGALAFVVFVRRTQVILDRPKNRLLLRSRSVLG